MWGLRAWRRRRALRRFALADGAWREAAAGTSLLRGLSADELGRLRQLTTLWLHEKSVQGAADWAVTEPMKRHIAVQACLLILNLGLDYYAGWSEVIIYPAAFWVHHEHMDAAGVVHHEHMPRVGESWERGPVILSWEDVQAAHAGFNVVIHEFAHKLDMLNGVANGMPPLHRNMAPAAWTRDFTAAYEDLCRRATAGWVTTLNPYATESPAEFFAVASESFFTEPALLRDAYPAVHDQLMAFYRQDPGRRF